MHHIIPNFITPDEIETLICISKSRHSEYETGRQQTGYNKLFVKHHDELQPLIQRSLAALHKPPEDEFWDAYLLHYPLDSCIPPHKDEAAAFGMVHHRLNAMVVLPAIGGIFAYDGEIFPLQVADALIFTPDSVLHSVTKIEVGERLVLSIGCWLPSVPGWE